MNSILSRTPRPVRDAAERELRAASERIADDEGKGRVGVETVIAAWIQTTPEPLRSALPQQMESMGLDPAEYSHLLG